MCLKRPILRKLLATLLTHKVLHSGVNCLVVGQSTGVREGPPTDIALVWFLACVDQSVSVSRALLAEGLSAHVARKGTFVVVYPHVLSHVPLRVELATHSARDSRGGEQLLHLRRRRG